MEQLVYYKDSPGLAKKTVITVHGETEYYENCKSYLEGYLVKGIDLKYNSLTLVWEKINNAVFDYELNKEVPEEKGLMFGIVAVDKKGVEKHGHFTPNPYRNCKVLMYDTAAFINCIDATILPAQYYAEDLSRGYWVKTINLPAYQLKQLSQKQLNVDFNGKTYNIEDNAKLAKASKELYENSVFPIDNDLKHLAKYLGDITWGVELETINGNLPEFILNKYGVIICKDGSIRDDGNRYPPEYVTIPLGGAKGLQVLRNLPPEIAKRSDINVKCSYHLHLGSFPIDRVIIVSLFRLARKIQKDVFKMFPLYKVNWKEYKQKNYCQKLPNLIGGFGAKNYNKYINDSYCDIYKFLTGGKDAGAECNRKNKVNPWGKNKWDIDTRYYWLNFINPVFGKRDTIEFRIHTPTLNPDKIINWLLMCIAVIRFAENQIVRCINNSEVSFVDVLNWYKDHFKTPTATKLSENLTAYYNNRVDYFKADANCNDILSPKELLYDGNFKFNTTKLF